MISIQLPPPHISSERSHPYSSSFRGIKFLHPASVQVMSLFNIFPEITGPIKGTCTLKYLKFAEILEFVSRRAGLDSVVTFKWVQGFAGADGGQGLLIVKLIVELWRGRGGVGVGVGVDVGFDLSL